jgi:predicted small lipoprotein YifL
MLDFPLAFKIMILFFLASCGVKRPPSTPNLLPSVIEKYKTQSKEKDKKKSKENNGGLKTP